MSSLAPLDETSHLRANLERYSETQPSNIMVRLRLQRFGAKREPYYRIVAADQRKARNGRFIEQLGTYDPKQEPAEVRIDGERAEYWVDNGAQPTDTVQSFIERLEDEAPNVTDLSEEGADEARREERRRQRREEIEKRRQELADAASSSDESDDSDEAEAADDEEPESDETQTEDTSETADESATDESSETTDDESDEAQTEDTPETADEPATDDEDADEDDESTS